jgi:predicted RNA-binding Zn-ribbon protein involved in translation (DUF1610 family)
MGVVELEVKFRCTSCGVKLGIDARCEGRKIQCPKCKCVMQVPIWSDQRDRASGVTLTADEVAFLSDDSDQLRTG